MVKRIEVALGKRSYSIHLGLDLQSHLVEEVKKLKASQIVLITDKNIEKIYSGLLKPLETITNFHKIILPAGEKNKNLLTMESIYTELVKFKVDRKSIILAFGGGVIGDMAGFAAASFLRGITFIQIPTTLLAMVDSSVGGKTGVNLKSGKNLVGAFFQPQAVWVDYSFLKTLPLREILCGLAEVIKYGCIWDYQFFNQLEALFLKYQKEFSQFPQDLTSEVWSQIIPRCCEIKAEVVSKDEKEGGLRAILNFGHTFGHALEAVTQYKTYSHGEAVACGMLYAANLSNQLGYLSNDQTERLKFIFGILPFKWKLSKTSFKKLYPYFLNDKKVENQTIHWILNDKQLGKVKKRSSVPLETLQKTYEQLRIEHA